MFDTNEAKVRAELFEEMNARLDEKNGPPEGSWSIYDYMSDTDLGRGAAKTRIQEALSMGLIEELPKRYNNVKYYRFVEKKMQG